MAAFGLIVGIVAALITILSAITYTGRRFWRWLVRSLGRRPKPPRTRVHIEPDQGFGNWTPVDLKSGEKAAFQMRCAITNLTPAYDLQLRGAELRGIRSRLFERPLTGRVHSVLGHNVSGTILPADKPVEMWLHFGVTRTLTPRARTGHVVLRDHLGNRYRSGRVHFRYVPDPRERAAATNA
jgi:hypothetical protein